MPTLLQWSETTGCGATIRLDSGEVVYVSLAGSRVSVRQWDLSNLWRAVTTRFFGAKLYRQGNAKKNARTAEALRALHPEPEPALPQFENLVLSIFINAIWHCASAAEVARVLDEAARAADRDQRKQ